MYNVNLFIIRDELYLTGQGVNCGGGNVHAGNGYRISKFNGGSWQNMVFMANTLHIDYSSVVQVREDILLLMGGNPFGPTDLVHKYEPSDDPNNLVLMDERVKIPSIEYQCAAITTDQIGYGVACTITGQAKVQWLALDDPNNEWPAWQYFSRDLPGVTPATTPMPVNFAGKLMVIQLDPTEARVFEWKGNSFWYPVKRSVLTLGVVPRLSKSSIIPWQIVEEKCWQMLK